MKQPIEVISSWSELDFTPGYGKTAVSKVGVHYPQSPAGSPGLGHLVLGYGRPGRLAALLLLELPVEDALDVVHVEGADRRAGDTAGRTDGRTDGQRMHFKTTRFGEVRKRNGK